MALVTIVIELKRNNSLEVYAAMMTFFRRDLST